MSFTPKECLDYPGFYHPVGDSHIVVSRDGRVINLRTGKELKTYQNSTGYITFPVPIIKDDQEWLKNYGLHRVLALAFIEIPEHLKHLSGRQLPVNHKDCNKHNNAISNLEWMTSKDNAKHGVLNEQNSFSKPVLSKDIETGEIQRHVSVTTCARAFDLDSILLGIHLNSPYYGTRYHDGYVFKFEDETPWPDLKTNILRPYKASRAVLAFNVKTQQYCLDQSRRAFCINAGLDTSAYEGFVQRNGEDTPYHDWLIKDVNLNESRDMTLFQEWIKKPKPLFHTVKTYKIINSETNQETTVNGFKEISDVTNYSITSLTNALKNNNGLVGDYQIIRLGFANSI